VSRRPNSTWQNQPVDNVCWDCLPGGYFGAYGPMNTKCLSDESCALIYPGQAGCPKQDAGSTIPFVVPFGTCACDQGGEWWPTSPNYCAKMEVTLPHGTGEYALYQCKDANCSADSCTFMAVWSPSMQVTTSYSCQLQGENAVMLSDGCTVVDPRAGGPLPLTAWCPHVGTIPNKSMGYASHASVDQLAAQLPLECELAPKCPESVLSDSRLAQSCCFGTAYSHDYDENGVVNKEVRAMPFCYNASGDVINGTHNEPYGLANSDCPVLSSAPGWRGCACLDIHGYRVASKTCTVECTAPDCPLPEGGVKPTPDEWVTSAVPDQVKPGCCKPSLTYTSSSLATVAALQFVGIQAFFISLYASLPI
jgi:hypothetical protein